MNYLANDWLSSFHSQINLPNCAGDVRCLLSLDEEFEESAQHGLAQFTTCKTRPTAGIAHARHLSELMIDRYGLALTTAPASSDLDMQQRLLDRIAKWASLWDYACAVAGQDTSQSMPRLIEGLWYFARLVPGSSLSLLRRLLQLRIQHSLHNDAQRARSIKAVRCLFDRHRHALQLTIRSSKSEDVVRGPGVEICMAPAVHRRSDRGSGVPDDERLFVSFASMRRSVLFDFHNNHASGLAEVRTWAWIERRLSISFPRADFRPRMEPSHTDVKSPRDC